MPFDLLVDRNEGPVIAVNVSLGGGTEGAPRRVADGAPPRTPALAETLLRTLLINSSGASADALAAGAYVLSPRIDSVGLLEFHQFDVMVAAGRAAARDLLEVTGGNFVAAVRRGARLTRLVIARTVSSKADPTVVERWSSTTSAGGRRVRRSLPLVVEKPPFERGWLPLPSSASHHVSTSCSATGVPGTAAAAGWPL